eukprot:2145187-Amphidinium_carterae.1
MVEYVMMSGSTSDSSGHHETPSNNPAISGRKGERHSRAPPGSCSGAAGPNFCPSPPQKIGISTDLRQF